MESVELKKEVESKDLLGLAQAEDLNRINQMMILSPENRSLLAETAKFLNIAGDPIEDEFQRKYILADGEFATEQSKLAQSILECNVRVENLANDQYMYEKNLLETDKLEIERDYKLGTLPEEQFKLQTRTVEAKLLDLEIKNKKVARVKLEIQSNNRFKEAIAWKKNIEKSLEIMGVKSVDEVDFTKTRMELMRAKIKGWGKLYAEGSFEWTPSKQQAVSSEKQAFDEGVMEGLQELQEVNPTMFIRRCNELGINILGAKPGSEQKQ